MKPIAICVGDITGIGPEVALKALAEEWAVDHARYLLVGDLAHLRTANEALRLNLPLVSAEERGEGDRLVCQSPPLDTPWPEAARLWPVRIPQGNSVAARAAVTWLRCAAECALRGEAAALVTAPVSKAAILRAGIPFVGQTEFLATLASTPRVVMMLLGADDRGRWLRVALATTHLPLRSVPEALRQENIERAIQLGAEACRKLGLPRARVGVCGLNPHAGEGGHLGTEEETLIAPAVANARRLHCDVHGPFAADTLFFQSYRGDYDVVVAMYHDQGLAPLKMVAFEEGINWTLGLPFVRTSPDHGTAYDLAGKGVANASSMRAAIRLAKQLTRADAG